MADEHTGSRPISTENLFRGQLVVGWVTTSEYWLSYVFCNFLSWGFDSREGGEFFFPTKEIVPKRNHSNKA